MATTKPRLNITLPKDMDKALKYLARRDKVTRSRKVVDLLEEAIEIEEDAVWAKLAAARDTKDAKFISHKEMWK